MFKVCLLTPLHLPSYNGLLVAATRCVPNEFCVAAIVLFYSSKSYIVFEVLLLYIISGYWTKRC